MQISLTFKSLKPDLQQVDQALKEQVKADSKDYQLRFSKGSLYAKQTGSAAVFKSLEGRKRNIDRGVEFIQGSAAASLKGVGLDEAAASKAAEDLMSAIVPMDLKAGYRIVRGEHVGQLREAIRIFSELRNRHAGDARFSVARVLNLAAGEARCVESQPKLSQFSRFTH